MADWSAVAVAGVVTITCTGAGALIATTDETNGTISANTLHAYYGKKGAIDSVLQDLSPVDMRKTSGKRGMNIYSSYLGGIKTFADGAKKFLNVLLAK